MPSFEFLVFNGCRPFKLGAREMYDHNIDSLLTVLCVQSNTTRGPARLAYSF
jgi:hypothetical protein